LAVVTNSSGRPLSPPHGPSVQVWVDANFKETQLGDLRIGQPADLYVDMYGGCRVFRGRIAGFTMGTGSTLTLLPPQNATGNFVKVVQRLPVRIELQDYERDKDPLFIGLSVSLIACRTPRIRASLAGRKPEIGIISKCPRKVACFFAR
jgi:multidrug resistance efflux pump